MGFGRTAVGGVALGLLLAMVQFSPGPVTVRLIAGEWAWFPRADSTAETLIWYSLAADAAVFVLLFGGVFGLGYLAGQDRRLASDYRPVLIRFAASGLIGYCLPLFLAVVYLAVLTPFVPGIPIIDALRTLVLHEVALLLGRVIAIPIAFAVIGLAGLAFADVSR